MEDLLLPVYGNEYTGGVDGKNTGQGVRGSQMSDHVAKSSVGRLLDFLSPLGKERVGGR